MIFLLALLAATPQANAEYPALMCSGSISRQDGAITASTQINKNVVMDSTYNMETIAGLSPKKDPNYNELVTVGKSDGSFEIFLRRMVNDQTKVMFRYNFGAADKNVSIPYKDAMVEVDLRCRRI